MSEEVKEQKVRRRRKRKDIVRFADLMVGNKYQTKSTGQLVQIVALDVESRAITYKALSTVHGVGAGRAAAAGEIRTVTNGHQWVAKLRVAPVEEVV